MTRSRWILVAGVGLGLAGTLVQLIFSGGGRSSRNVRQRTRVSPASRLPLTVPQAEAATRIRAAVAQLRPELGPFEGTLLAQAVLAWAQGESGLGRAMQGDLHWATNHPDQYRRRVLESASYQDNPHRTDASAWTSYGFFHQLAADWLRVAIAAELVPFDAHPNRLADPDVSLALGVPMVLRTLAGQAAHPWPEAFIRARLLCKGCGADGSRCDAETVAIARANALRVLGQFQVLEVGPTPETLVGPEDARIT